MLIQQNENFEGTIQIVYNLYPRFKIKTDLEFQAKIKENIQSDEIIAMESNVCNFHYTSIKSSYSFQISARAAEKVDYTKIEDILNDYYWVRYSYKYPRVNSGVIKSSDGSNEFMLDFSNYKYDCIKQNLPEGCVIYDQDLNKLEPQEENTYYYLKNSVSFRLWISILLCRIPKR